MDIFTSFPRGGSFHSSRLRKNLINHRPPYHRKTRDKVTFPLHCTRYPRCTSPFAPISFAEPLASFLFDLVEGVLTPPQLRPVGVVWLASLQQLSYGPRFNQPIVAQNSPSLTIEYSTRRESNRTLGGRGRGRGGGRRRAAVGRGPQRDRVSPGHPGTGGRPRQCQPGDGGCVLGRRHSHGHHLVVPFRVWRARAEGCGARRRSVAAGEA